MGNYVKNHNMVVKNEKAMKTISNIIKNVGRLKVSSGRKKVKKYDRYCFDKN